MSDDRYDRQIRLFGREGQERLEAIRVAIVGLGGLGSHVAQQLAYLGIRRYALIDHDVTTETNLNRLIGANELDVQARRTKVEIAERHIRFILPEAEVEAVPKPFITEQGYAALRDADVVVGCMDADASRAILNEFCQAYEISYMDIATDTGGEGETWFGGRILYSAGGELCLRCMDVLDQEAVDRALSTEAQERDRDQIYGVPRKALGGTGPAVVSLNGVLASVAVTELTAEITRLRRAHRYLEYRGDLGVLRTTGDAPQKDCWYCKGLRGAGDEADLLRYVREGWAERLFGPPGDCGRG